MSAALSDDEIDARFHLLGRMEIVSALDELVRRRESVTAHFDAGRQFFVTMLLEAGAHGIVFDLGGHEPTNALLAKAGNAVLVARPNGIRVQFVAGPVTRITWGGQPAFHAPLPARVARMQRRESFRIVTPQARPLLLRWRDGGGSLLGELPLHDLCVAGCGGDLTGEVSAEVGETVPAIEFRLPNSAPIRCAARIRHRTPVGNAERVRVGCEFLALPRHFEIEIQRYIVAVEHERHRLATGE